MILINGRQSNVGRPKRNHALDRVEGGIKETRRDKQKENHPLFENEFALIQGRWIDFKIKKRRIVEKIDIFGDSWQFFDKT